MELTFDYQKIGFGAGNLYRYSGVLMIGRSRGLSRFPEKLYSCSRNYLIPARHPVGTSEIFANGYHDQRRFSIPRGTQSPH